MEHIGFRPQILGLLKRLHQDRCLLAVTLANSGPIYTSALLEIDPEQNIIVLDELRPESGHAELLTRRHCRIRGELKGVTVSFTAELIDSGHRDDIAYYRLTCPASLHYGQRRAHYRPRVGLSNKTTVELQLPAGQVLTGNLQDLSLGGLRIKLDHDLAGLTLNARLPCRLTLPGATVFECTIEIRSLSGAPSPQLGARFEPFLPGQRQLLQKFLRELEREELKKNPR